MVEKRILLRDLMARLMQSEAGEIYVDAQQLEADVFVLPVMANLGYLKSDGTFSRDMKLAEKGTFSWYFRSDTT